MGFELRVKFTEWAVCYASVCDEVEHMKYELEGDAYTKKRAKTVGDETWKQTKALVKTSIINRSAQARQVTAAHAVLKQEKYEEYLAQEAKRKIAEAAITLETEALLQPRWPDERSMSPQRVGSGTMSIGSIGPEV